MTDHLAVDLLHEQYRVQERLAALRVSAGMTVDGVADRAGWTVGKVLAVETPGGDPVLSDIRLYALIVGATIQHDVEEATDG